MNFSTEYLGMKLPHPLVAGASPLADDLDGVKRLEDAGAAAIVLRSLFEEQITREQMSEHINLDSHGESFAEAASYFPGPDALELNLYRISTDPDTAGESIEREAIETVRAVKRTVTIPVAVKLSPFYTAIANLARALDQAGADGLV